MEISANPHPATHFVLGCFRRPGARSCCLQGGIKLLAFSGRDGNENWNIPKHFPVIAVYSLVCGIGCLFFQLSPKLSKNPQRFTEMKGVHPDSIYPDRTGKSKHTKPAMCDCVNGHPASWDTFIPQLARTCNY